MQDLTLDVFRFKNAGMQDLALDVFPDDEEAALHLHVEDLDKAVAVAG
jgi:hypothetical protein